MSKNKLNQVNWFYNDRRENIQDRAIIFLDQANVLHNLLKSNIRIDYKKFKEIMAGDYHLVGSLAYMGIPENVKSKKKGFIRYLGSVGYVIIKVPLKIFPDGKMKQKRIDMLIHKHMLEFAQDDAFDVAILVSGDEDFMYAVKKVKEMNKEVKIWSFKSSLSNKLIKIVGLDNAFLIDDVLDHIIYKKKGDIEKIPIYKRIIYYLKSRVNKKQMVLRKGE